MSYNEVEVQRSIMKLFKVKSTLFNLKLFLSYTDSISRFLLNIYHISGTILGFLPVIKELTF